MKKISAIIFLSALFFGCSPQANQEANSAVDAATGLGAAKTKIEQVDPQLAIIKCQDVCRSELMKGTDLSAGPCLGNPIPGIPQWVCDVAHNPRQAVDNLPEHQCSAFRGGQAKHFIELDEQCGVIKTN
ncbi:MAG: hypothetical protein PHI63_01880 [Patescibacteria group bacterium]|nr:hypothetical protein [Patescibacteria group bacterium]